MQIHCKVNDDIYEKIFMPHIFNPFFKPEIDFLVDEQTVEDRSTIIHCLIRHATGIRIWPSTFLVQENGTRKKMLFAYNITQHPQYTWVDNGHIFTLVFEGLDKSCSQFHLLEDIPEPGGFYRENIQRNKTDVYTVEVSW